MADSPDPLQLIQQAVGLHQSGHLSEAESLYRQFLSHTPGEPTALYLLGVCLLQTKRPQEAIRHISTAIEANPRQPDYHYNLAEAYRAAERPNDATRSYEQAVALQPDYTQAWHGLGMVRQMTGDLQGAITAFQQELKLDPSQRFPPPVRQVKIARDCLNTETKREKGTSPSNQQTTVDLASCLRDIGNLEESNHLLRPLADCPRALSLLGLNLQSKGQILAAEASIRKALELEPDSVLYKTNLALTLSDQGKVEQSVELYQQALRQEPDFAALHSNLLFMLNFSPAETPESLDQAYRDWNRKFGTPKEQYKHPPLPQTKPQKIRIGYASPNFKTHAVGIFLKSLLPFHDHEQFEIHCFSDCPPRKHDDLTRIYQSHADHWHDTHSLSHPELADLIHRTGIHILVDLNQHMSGSRMPTFALKPAPIQFTWVGFTNTTGLSSIDYRLSDPTIDPPGQSEHLNSETLIRLPHSIWCYVPEDTTPPPSPLPSLTNAHITFGSFNNFIKINSRVFELWARLLHQTPGSRLLLKATWCAEPEGCLEIRRRFGKLGVAPERIDLVGWCSRQDYWLLHHKVDICLDPFPYNGCTTLCDALWMGVPTLAIRGSLSPGARMSHSILKTAGLENWVASDEREFLTLAHTFTDDTETLSSLRASIRGQMLASPLCDAPAYTRAIENAYLDAWASASAL